jgi:copper(I)-binding protein
MKRRFYTLAMASLCLVPTVIFAAPAGSMVVSNCWIRSLPGDLPSGGYFTMMNMSDSSVDLTGVETKTFRMSMLHQSLSNGGTTSMVMIDKVTVPPKGTLTFAPGNYHVMLEKPTKPLKIGASIPLTFVFGDSEKVTTECAVKSPGAAVQ